MAQQIESKDIKLYASEKLLDTNDGGGRVTSTEIESGQINNVFQDISRVDHANGSVELRKLFMGIRTPNNAPLLGAHMLVVEPPQDPNVSVAIFQTPKEGRETDVRTAARDYLETYYVRGGRELATPLGINLEGSQALTLTAPSVIPVSIKAGDTIVLFNSQNGAEEYVKVQSIARTVQIFIYIDASGNVKQFRAQVFRCSLAAPLTQAWDGGEATPTGTENKNILVYKTLVSGSARYRGTTKLDTQLDAGETIASVEAVVQPIVPVARQEQALVGRSPYEDIAPVIRSANADETPVQIKATPVDNEGVLYMPTAVTKGSMTITASGSIWTENGSGSFIKASGASNAEFMIDYATGTITYAGISNVQITFEYLPAASADVPAITTGVEITQANLGLVYTFDLSDLKPETGTLRIEYMANNDWLVMNDNGQGLIEGQGVGTVDYDTGQIQITLEAEPEVGSWILLSYLPSASLFLQRQSGTQQVSDLTYARSINIGGTVTPNTVTVQNTAGTLTSTDDGAGNISGTAGDGFIDYVTGKITLNPTAASFFTEYAITADVTDEELAGTIRSSFPIAESGGNLTIQIGQTIKSGSVRFTIPIRNKVQRQFYDGLVTGSGYAGDTYYNLRDDGSGKIVNYYGMGDYGTIDYATGEIYLPNALKTKTSVQVVNNPITGLPEMSDYTETMELASNTPSASLTALIAHATATQRTTTIPVDAVELQITDIDDKNPIIPKSVWLRVESNDYFDDGNGRLIGSYNATTGAGVQVGSIDYINGKVDMQSLSVTASAVSVKSLMTLGKGVVSGNLLFAIKDRPLRHGSFQMNIETVDGTVKRYQADESGVIKVVSGGSGTIGSINIQTGIVSINTSALAGTVASKISVLGSLRYNAVKSESLPADPDIVGLNVQRLPIDGRVPIFKLGDTVVFSHWGVDAIDKPTDNAVETLSRDHLAEVIVLCDGTALDPDMYEIDLEAGTVTFADPLTLQDENQNALSGTWTIKHRIEHMTLTTRVQQNGQLTLQVPSAHDFPIGTTVSSALLFGDLQADVANIYTQKTWQNNAPNWTDTPDSSGETTARYDTINYPIQVSNESAITDKWALIFTSQNVVNVVSEGLGVILTNVPIGSEIAPINPVTSKPYFVINQLGWGGGWTNGNAMRFNTASALAPFWIARTVTPAQGVTESDSFTLSPRGDSQ